MEICILLEISRMQLLRIDPSVSVLRCQCVRMTTRQPITLIICFILHRLYIFKNCNHAPSGKKSNADWQPSLSYQNTLPKHVATQWYCDSLATIVTCATRIKWVVGNPILFNTYYIWSVVTLQRFTSVCTCLCIREISFLLSMLFISIYFKWGATWVSNKNIHFD